jgi:hypothetical protein
MLKYGQAYADKGTEYYEAMAHRLARLVANVPTSCTSNALSNYSEKGPPNLDFRSLRFRLERVFGERGCQGTFFSLHRRRGYFPRHPAPLTIEDARLVSCPWD